GRQRLDGRLRVVELAPTVVRDPDELDAHLGGALGVGHGQDALQPDRQLRRVHEPLDVGPRETHLVVVERAARVGRDLHGLARAPAREDVALAEEDVLSDREPVQVALVAAQGRFRLAAAVAEVPRFAGERRPGGAANLGESRERAGEFFWLGHGAVLYASPRPESWYTAATPRKNRRRGHDMDGNGTSARGVRQVGYFDCAGGGQVVVDGRVAFVAHMKAPHGTTLVDVSDPSRPRQLASIEVEPGTHSHKVRAGNGLMLVTR